MLESLHLAFEKRTFLDVIQMTLCQVRNSRLYGSAQLPRDIAVLHQRGRVDHARGPPSRHLRFWSAFVFLLRHPIVTR